MLRTVVGALGGLALAAALGCSAGEQPMPPGKSGQQTTDQPTDQSAPANQGEQPATESAGSGAPDSAPQPP